MIALFFCVAAAFELEDIVGPTDDPEDAEGYPDKYLDEYGESTRFLMVVDAPPNTINLFTVNKTGPLDDVDAIFKRYDTDGSGDIDLTELSTYKTDAQHFLSQYDQDQSGRLERGEFGNLVAASNPAPAPAGEWFEVGYAAPWINPLMIVSLVGIGISAGLLLIDRRGNQQYENLGVGANPLIEAREEEDTDFGGDDADFDADYDADFDGEDNGETTVLNSGSP
jgi:hypothetical protein